MSIHVVFKQIYLNKQTNVFSCLNVLIGTGVIDVYDIS